MYYWKGKIILIGLILLTVTAGYKFLSQTYDLGDQRADLAIGVANDTLTLDPAIATESETFRITGSIYETLVSFDPSGKQFKNALAENFRRSEDGLTWTFKIRKGIKFHDGEILNAEAVAFNFNRWMDAESPYHTGHFSYWKYNFGGFPGIVKKVNVLSEYSLEIVLNKPYAPFISTLAMPAFGIASPKAIEIYNEKFGEHPIGTGPFQFSAWEKEKKVILQQNPDYWKGRTAVNLLEFIVIENPSDRMEALKTGSIDIAFDLRANQKEAIDLNETLNTYLKPFFNTGYLAMNNEVKPLDNLNVRKAISILIDRKRMTSEIFDDFARESNSFIPPMLWGYNNELINDGVNIKKAKQLLAEAHYPDGFTVKLWVMDTPRNYFPDPMRLAEFIKDSLHDGGIEVEIIQMNWDQYKKVLREGGHQLALMGWNGDIIDPDNFLYTLFASENANVGTASNYSFYKNTKVDQMLKLARQTDDKKFRQQIYMEVQTLIQDDMPSLPLVHTMSIVGVSKRIKGYQPSISSNEDFFEIKIMED